MRKYTKKIAILVPLLLITATTIAETTKKEKKTQGSINTKEKSQE